MLITKLLLPLLLFSVPLYALDHRNLDEQVPLQVEDAYPLKYRELAVQILGFFGDQQTDSEEGGAYLELEYGFARNFQLSVNTELFSRSPGESEGSGNLNIDLLYNFNTETMRFPAFAASVGTELPTGEGVQGTDIFFQGIITRSFRFHRFHLNAGYTFALDAPVKEREARWRGVIGWDYPAGLHSILLANVVFNKTRYAK